MGTVQQKSARMAFAQPLYTQVRAQL